MQIRRLLRLRDLPCCSCLVSGVGPSAFSRLSPDHIRRLEPWLAVLQVCMRFAIGCLQGRANRERKSVSARKARSKKQKKSRKVVSFTADDIVRAIEAVEQTGLTVYGVEITLNGSIKINTASPFKRAAASKSEMTADVPDEIQPAKKRA